MADTFWPAAAWDWLVRNKDWLFSGAGLFVVGYIIKLLFGKRSVRSVNQKAKVSRGGTVLQAGRDITHGGKDATRQ